MQIYILDKDINIIGVFSTYESIIWTEKLHEPGTFKATFIFTKEMNQKLQRGNLLYKTDEAQPGIIKRKFLKLNKSGEQTIVVQGYMASRYLNQRIIWEKMVLKGTPEQVMRRMVEEQVIDPKIPERKMPLIELGEFRGYELDQIEKQITYDNLQEALTELSKTSGLGYRLRLDYARKKFVFDIYQGMDRTLGTDKPCIFTRKYGNVFTQEYSEDESNYRNICLVGGPGEDDQRVRVAVGNAAGLERYELFYNASRHSGTDVTQSELISQLQQKGLEKLAAYKEAKAFESKINREKSMAFALGDYVTCVDKEWNVTVDTQIKEVKKGLSKMEESCVVTFGDNVPTLVDLIKAKE